jgi:hypothetical protein
MMWFLFQVLKFVLIVAAVLAYTEIGPGGEVLASMIGSTKELILSVDYADWWEGVSENLRGFSETVVLDFSGDEE